MKVVFEEVQKVHLKRLESMKADVNILKNDIRQAAEKADIIAKDIDSEIQAIKKNMATDKES